MIKKITTIEDLAAMIQRTMASKEELQAFRMEMATKGDLRRLEQTLEQKMEDGFRAVNRRIDLLHEDISDLPDIREEVQDYDERIARVERKVGFAK